MREKMRNFMKGSVHGRLRILLVIGAVFAVSGSYRRGTFRGSVTRNGSGEVTDIAFEQRGPLR